MKFPLKLCILLLFCNAIWSIDDDTDEVSNDKSEEANGDDDAGDDKVYVCDEKAKHAVCRCEDKKLTCYHEFVNGDIMETAEVYLKKSDFVIGKATFTANSIHELKKGQILPENTKTVTLLDFGNNIIHIIEDGAFDDFEVLEELDLNNNYLTTIDKKVFTKKLGSTLKTLKLYHNKIQDLNSHSFKYLANLVYLDLDNNPELEVDSGIFGKSLSKLETLELNFCNIETLDDETFINLISLKVLQLKGNPLAAFPVAVSNIPRLAELYLSETQISEINTDRFDPNNNITNLLLSKMDKLTTLDDCAFCGLPKLKYVDISSSKHLSKIHENAFGSLTKSPKKLEKFYFSSLNLSTISENLIDWESPSRLSLSGNPFNCDCTLAWFVNNYASHRSKIIWGAPICSSPSEFKNKTFGAVAGSVCEGKGESTSNGPKVLWVLSLFIFAVIVFVVFKNRKAIKRRFMLIRIRQEGYNNFSPVFV